MDRYGRAESTEGTQGDREGEWSLPAGETGLEEPMWQLALVGGPELYPDRPGEADCIHYLRTGFCGYGSRCRFNHPRDRGSAAGLMRTSGWEYPERVGQPLCQYYMRTGMCKFGASCKYNHPRQGSGSPNPVALNASGYPLRPGDRECSFYMKTGQCKFGVTCKFHHPQPAGMQVPAVAAHVPLPLPSALPTLAFYPSMQSLSVQSSEQYGPMAGNWPAARSAVLPGSYLHGTYGPMIVPPGMVSISGWSPNLAPLSRVASPTDQATAGTVPIYGMTQLPPSAPAYAGPYFSIPSSLGPSSSIQKELLFPERPGQPECSHYMKTGDCKFGSSCRYHHPPEWSVSTTNFTLSPMGLPLRPGAPLCSHYTQNGICKFGPSCRFDHPMEALSYSPSASSLADMPVAPYPVGSSIATLAPSSSSSDIRPELMSASNKDNSARLPSPTNSSRGSAGSLFRRSGDLPRSSAQQPGQAPSVGSSSSSIDHEGVAHRAGQKG